MGIFGEYFYFFEFFSDISIVWIIRIDFAGQFWNSFIATELDTNESEEYGSHTT